MNRFAFALVLIVLAPAVAPASQQGVIVIKNWQSADRCAKQAQAAFPDYTPESNAKRDAKLAECLQGMNMPAREPLSPHQ